MKSNTPGTPRRTLSVFSLVMINVIAIDNLRSLPFSAEYGAAAIGFYCLATIFFLLPTAFVTTELATGWPNKGGIYVWVREAFGTRWGFFVIWLQWIYNVAWYPTILIFVASIFAYLIEPALAQNKAYMLTTVFLLFIGVTLINCFGMRLSSAISTVGALVGTLFPMGCIILLGSLWIAQGHPISIDLHPTAWLPHFSGASEWSFLIAVVFGLVGIEMSAVHADEVKNPERAYPRAILISVIIIIASLVFASLAVAVIVPKHTLNIVTGITQAFDLFFKSYHVHWMLPILSALMIIGGLGSVATWIIGPTKGLLVAAQDGIFPTCFQKVNRHGVPLNLLLLQTLIFSGLCSVFVLMPSMGSAYMLLTAMTAQLALLVYVLLFAAAWRLRSTQPHITRAYRIPGGTWGMRLICAAGLLSCVLVILLGFVPPAELHIQHIVYYDTILSIGMLVLCAPAWFIPHRSHGTEEQRQ